MSSTPNTTARATKYLDELLVEIENPVHRQLIEYFRDNLDAKEPVKELETKLGKILLEILDNED